MRASLRAQGILHFAQRNVGVLWDRKKGRRDLLSRALPLSQSAEFETTKGVPVGRELRLNQLAVRVGLRRIVAAAHVHFDIAEAMLCEMRLQLRKRIRRPGLRH